MHYAAKEGQLEVAMWLFSSGASVTEKEEVCCQECQNNG